MSQKKVDADPQKSTSRKPRENRRETNPAISLDSTSEITRLQGIIGNQAVQRLIAQRSGEGSFDLDDNTAQRINNARSDGQPIDDQIQEKLGSALGQDFNEVRIHTSAEADQLSRQINAKAFTTQNDIFFRQGAYEPNSASGQKLLAHELTHVVQQNSGGVGGSSEQMAVNAPEDSFERQADAVSKAVTSDASAQGGVQRDPVPEEEEDVLQRQEEDQEDEERL